ncbi:MAG: T9SS type A sorting domain-containing protein [Candidatus Kapaibacterium sp.]
MIIRSLLFLIIAAVPGGTLLSGDVFNSLNSGAMALPKVQHSGYKQFERMNYLLEIRLGNNRKIPHNNYRIKEYRKFIDKAKQYKLNQSANWEPMGPDGYYSESWNAGVGRINCIVINPFDSSEYWAGAATGGLWRSIDSGYTWEQISISILPVTGISDIAFDPEKHGTAYAATGDHAVWPWFGTLSTGIIKTTDGGITWSETGLNYDHSEKMSIAELHCTEDGKLYAGTNEGLMVSSDGGGSWGVLYGGEYIRSFLVFEDKNVIIAATYNIEGGARIMKSTDSGNSWSVILNPDNSSRIKLALSSSGKLAALSSSIDSNTDGLYTSIDNGNSWSKFSEQDIVYGQGFYNLALDFYPGSDEEIFAGGVFFHYSDDGGNNFRGANSPHVDYHDIIFNDKYLIVANDGGIYRSPDKGKSWEFSGHGLNITQFYKVGPNPEFKDFSMGGSQDNGTLRFTYGEWDHLLGGDGMECAFDPFKADCFYVSIQRGSLFRVDPDNRQLNQIFTWEQDGHRVWVTQFELSLITEARLFAAYSDIWQSDDRGESWKNLTEFSEKKLCRSFDVLNDTLIAAAYDDEIYFSNDGGNSWQMIFEPPEPANSVKIIDEKIVFIGMAGFDPDEKAYLWEDGLLVNISDGLPNLPILTAEYIAETDELYAGTDIGIFKYSQEKWDYQHKAPNCMIHELEFSPETGYLYAATYGQGLWKYDISSCENDDILLNAFDEMICVNDTLTVSPLLEKDKELPLLWNDGVVASQRQFSRKGTYFAVYTDDEGCRSYTNPVIIDKYFLPVNRLYILNNKICEGRSTGIKLILFDRNFNPMEDYDGYEIKWNTGFTGDSIVISDQGYYFANIIDKINGCELYSDTIYIGVNPLPEEPEIIRTGRKLTATESHSYRWFLNGEPIDGGTGRTHFIDQPGEYMVEVRDTNWCPNYSDIFEIYPNEAIAIDNIDISLFPNPAASEFNMELYIKEEADIKINLYSITGHLIKKWKLQKHGYIYESFDIAGIARGAYYLKIEINGGSGIYPLIKNK